MDAVKAFNNELSSLYDVKPPISKAKMNSLTRGAIKAIKFYKHVVQSVEKFIQKCKAEYKVPGLYVIDSIVRQSRHQFGPDKDVFAPRFAKNMQQTFLNLLKCPPEDKSKVIRVLNLWQKNSVFPPEVIQPLFDLADPNHPIHKEQSNGNNLSTSTPLKSLPSTAKNTPKDQKLFTTAKPIDPAWLAQTKMETANIVNANKLMHLQQLLLKKQEAASNEASQSSSVKFDKKLLDFDYGEEEDDDISTSPKLSQNALAQHNAMTSATNNLESLGLLLTNPEVLRQIQALQQTMQNSTHSAQNEMEEKMRKLQQMKQQEEEFDKHLAQTVPTLPFASECELKPSDAPKTVAPPPPPPPPVVPFPLMGLPMMPQDMSQPPPGYPSNMPFVAQPPPPLMRPPISQANLTSNNQPVLITQSPRIEENNMPRRENSVEIVNEPPRSSSRSPDRYRSRRSRSRSPRHRRKSRSRTRSRTRSSSRSISISRSHRRRSRSRDRKHDDGRDKMTEEEREKDRERRKRGLPPLMREKLSVCSTTLWVGHLSKLVHQEELSDTFGEIGDIVSIDLISPRGCAFICMNRRQDAYKALTKLKNHKMQGKAITLAWAPGKGVKGKDWKDYWEVEAGVTYIPWNKLANVSDQELELFEEGGMIDEDSMPPWLKSRRRHNKNDSDLTHMQSVGMVNMNDVMGQHSVPTSSGAPMVDTSQPPPVRAPTAPANAPAPPIMPPPNQLQMMPPGFTMPPGMLGPMGLQMPPGLMGNVPLGVPPPNMQSLMPGMMQQMMQSVNSPFGLLTQIPMPTPAAPSDKPNATGMPHNVPPLGVAPPTTEPGMPNLPMMRQPFGVPPMPLQQMPPMSQQNQRQQQQQNPPLPMSDDMDVDMEDDMVPPIKEQQHSKPPSLLSDQLLAAMKNDRDERDSFRDRERDRDRRDRDRGGLGDRDRDDNRSRDRGRGRDRGGRDRNRRDSRDNGNRNDRDERRDREARDNRHSPMRDMINCPGGLQGLGGNHIGENDKKDGMGPKLSLADRLRQLADGTLPLIDDRNIDRDMRGGTGGPTGSRSNDRSSERMDRSSSDRLGRASSMEGQPPPPSLLAGARRPGEGPPSLLDLPAKFPGVPPVPDFPGNPNFGGPRVSERDVRDFPRGAGPGDRDRPFGSRVGPMGGRSGSMDDFMEGPRSLLGPRFGPPDDFPIPSGRPDEYDLRRDKDGRPQPPGRLDEFERGRGPPFDFDMRGGRNAPGDIPPPFDMPRMPLDEFELREMADFDRRREFYMLDKFGPLGMSPRFSPRGIMGNPDAFGPRGGRGGLGPMFHPRSLGPRGMRPAMRPPYGPRGGPMPFDGPDGPFFRGAGGAYDDGRGPLPPLGRGPFSIDGPPSRGMPPPLMGGPLMNEGPWRDGLLGPGGPRLDDGMELMEGSSEKSEERRKNDKEERENRRRETRKSRWGNASPSARNNEGDNADHQDQSQQDKSESASGNDKNEHEDTWNSSQNNEAENDASKVPAAQNAEQWNESTSASAHEQTLEQGPSSWNNENTDKTNFVPDSMSQTEQNTDSQSHGGFDQPQEYQENYATSQNCERNQEMNEPQQNEFEQKSEERFDSAPQERFERAQESFEPPPFAEKFESAAEQRTESFDSCPMTQEHFEETSSSHNEHDKFDQPQERFESVQEHFETSSQQEKCELAHIESENNPTSTDRPNQPEEQTTEA
ncbi:splicing factor, arginine/serine-rich 15 [Trichogramma pretiosum]|uniref:splicing factor, arginine/serine-rich 15 n=1 Tax=Trichogramma pretiosum TaxID=7493 RepID=UPI0006C9CFC1|nr:splicing factor, arginine/serine-rich 15 [Trichogramma pretiosum]